MAHVTTCLEKEAYNLIIALLHQLPCSAPLVKLVEGRHCQADLLCSSLEGLVVHRFRRVSFSSNKQMLNLTLWHDVEFTAGSFRLPQQETLERALEILWMFCSNPCIAHVTMYIHM